MLDGGSNRMGRKTIREEIRKKEAALKRAEDMIKELRTAVDTKNHNINELQNILNSDGISTRELEELNRTKIKDLEKKIIEMEIEKRAFETKLEEKKKEAQDLLDNMNAEITALRKSLKAKQEDLGQEIRENERIRKQIEKKEEELKALRSLLKEKDRDIEEFCEALKNGEQELNEKLSEKDLEIAEIKTSLLTTKHELQLINERTFQKRLRACFLTAQKV
jgi:chromosome segregation ATPase